MIGIRAKYVAMRPMADDSVKFIFQVEKEFADLAADIMGLPKSSGAKEFNILPHIDRATDAYEIEEPSTTA